MDPGNTAPAGDSLDALRAERDLYRALLDLVETQSADTFLESALDLLLKVTGAELGYLAWHANESDGAPLWSATAGFTTEEIAEMPDRLSNGIIQSALSSGRLVQTSSAMLDPRFRERKSVRHHKIEAVLCAPIGTGPMGVLYLQGRNGGGPFPAEAQALAARVVTHLEPLAGNWLAKILANADPTLGPRAALRECNMVGRSQVVAALLRQIAGVAPLDVDILLSGPTGSGKTETARLIHRNSQRAAGPFVELNCAAIPAGLLEAELFGATAGSYTGSTHDRVGLVGAAEGGTLLLDEIGELPLVAQAKLLQVVQDRIYHRVGESRPRSANIRLVAATHRSLDDGVAQGWFRADLRYRLGVVHLHLPSLEQRRGDIPRLALYFLRGACERHTSLGGMRLSPAALQVLRHAPWPGEVRQLAHTVEAAAIRAHTEGSRVVGPGHLGIAGVDDDPSAYTWQAATWRLRRKLLLETLEANDWNVTVVAKQLDLARSHVYEMMRAFSLTREST